MSKELQIFYSKKKSLIFMLVALILAFVAYLLISNQYVVIIGSGRDATAADYAISVGIGWAIMALVAVFYIIFIPRILKKDPQIIISEKGIQINGYQNYHSVSWDQVSSVSVKKDFIFKNVSVNLHDPEAYIEGAKRKMVRFTMKSNLKRMGSPLQLNLMVLDVSADEIVSECNLFLMGRKSY